MDDEWSDFGADDGGWGSGENEAQLEPSVPTTQQDDDDDDDFFNSSNASSDHEEALDEDLTPPEDEFEQQTQQLSDEPSVAAASEEVDNASKMADAPAESVEEEVHEVDDATTEHTDDGSGVTPDVGLTETLSNVTGANESDSAREDPGDAVRETPGDGTQEPPGDDSKETSDNDAQETPSDQPLEIADAGVEETSVDGAAENVEDNENDDAHVQDSLLSSAINDNADKTERTENEANTGDNEGDEAANGNAPPGTDVSPQQTETNEAVTESHEKTETLTVEETSSNDQDGMHADPFFAGMDDHLHDGPMTESGAVEGSADADEVDDSIAAVSDTIDQQSDPFDAGDAPASGGDEWSDFGTDADSNWQNEDFTTVDEGPFSASPMYSEATAALDTTSTKQASGQSSSADDSAQPLTAEEEFRAHIAAIFEQYDPARLEEVDGLVSVYLGMESKLIRRLVKRYGPDPYDTALDSNTFGVEDPEGQSLFGDALGDPYSESFNIHGGEDEDEGDEHDVLDAARARRMEDAWAFGEGGDDMEDGGDEFSFVIESDAYEDEDPDAVVKAVVSTTPRFRVETEDGVDIDVGAATGGDTNNQGEGMAASQRAAIKGGQAGTVRKQATITIWSRRASALQAISELQQTAVGRLIAQAQAVRVFWAHDVPGHFKSANATLDRLQKYLDSRTAADMQYARSLSALPSIVLKPGGLDGVPGIGGRGASRSTYSPRHLVRKLREQQHRLQEHAQAERRAYDEELAVLKSFLAENNLPEMLASILLDNAVNKAKLLTLTEEECDNLGLGPSVAKTLYAIGAAHRENAENHPDNSNGASEQSVNGESAGNTETESPVKVRRFLNDQHLQATLASIQRLQAWEPGLQTSIRELETVESAVARRMHKFAEISKAKLAALGVILSRFAHEYQAVVNLVEKETRKFEQQLHSLCRIETTTRKTYRVVDRAARGAHALSMPTEEYITREIGDIAVPENAMATKAFHQFKQVYDELEVAHKSGKMPVTDLWLADYSYRCEIAKIGLLCSGYVYSMVKLFRRLTNAEESRAEQVSEMIAHYVGGMRILYRDFAEHTATLKDVVSGLEHDLDTLQHTWYYEFWSGESGPIVDSKQAGSFSERGGSKSKKQGTAEAVPSEDRGKDAPSTNAEQLGTSGSDSTETKVVSGSEITAELSGSTSPPTPSANAATKALPSKSTPNKSAAQDEAKPQSTGTAQAAVSERPTPASKATATATDVKPPREHRDVTTERQPQGKSVESSKPTVENSASVKAAKPSQSVQIPKETSNRKPSLSEESDDVWHLQFDFPSAALGVHLVGGKPTAVDADGNAIDPPDGRPAYTPIEVAAFAVDSPGRDLGMREGDEIECINNIMIHGEKSLTHLKEVVGAIAQTRNRLVVMVRRRKPDPALLKQDLGELTREVMEMELSISLLDRGSEMDRAKIEALGATLDVLKTTIKKVKAAQEDMKQYGDAPAETHENTTVESDHPQGSDTSKAVTAPKPGSKPRHSHAPRMGTRGARNSVTLRHFAKYMRVAALANPLVSEAGVLQHLVGNVFQKSWKDVFCIITRDRFLHVFEKEKGGFMDFAGMLQNHGPGGNTPFAPNLSIALRYAAVQRVERGKGADQWSQFVLKDLTKKGLAQSEYEFRIPLNAASDNPHAKLDEWIDAIQAPFS